MIHIRSFVPQDSAAIAEVILTIQRNEFDIPITLEGQPDLADVPGFYQRGSGNFWVAEVDGTVVGTIGLLDIGGKQAALRKMFVAAPYRGKEYGIAQLLLRELLTWSAGRHLEIIYLGTTDRFLAAHRFYEKNGFREIERGLLPNTFPIMSVDTKFYALTVDASPANPATGTSHRVNGSSQSVCRSDLPGLRALQLQDHKEQTAHLQAALLRSSPARAQIPTARRGSIRSSSSPFGSTQG